MGAGRAGDFGRTDGGILDRYASLVMRAEDAINATENVDKAADTAKNKSNGFSEFPKKVHEGRQGKHIKGHNNYKESENKSIFDGSMEKAQKLIDEYSGTGVKKGANKEAVDFKENIGTYIDPKTGKAYETTRGTIHYSKDGAHIVPAQPNSMIKGEKKYVLKRL